MKAALLAVVLAGCSEPGLLLDVIPAGTNVASVEVLVPDQVGSDALGMPPANSGKTPGPVYTVTDRLTATVDGDHHVRLLLQVDSQTNVPALLLVGYDANHDAVEQMVLPGPLTLRHTQSDQLVVHLAPVAQVTVVSALDPNGPPRPRLARWSAQKLDDPAGDCIAVLDNTGNSFFSKHDDPDCDGAEPECDPEAYLVTEPTSGNAGALCVTRKPPDTNGACRLGLAVDCKDNVGDCDTSARTVCVPRLLCDDCDVVDSACLATAIPDPNLLRVHCQIDVMVDSTTQVPIGVCGAGAAVVDLSAHFGSGWTCGLGGFSGLSNPANPMASIALASSDGHLDLACKTQMLNLSLEQPLPTMFDHPLVDTTSTVVIPTTDGTQTGVIALPFVAQWNPVLQCSSNNSLTCELRPPNASDPIWHCAGGN